MKLVDIIELTCIGILCLFIVLIVCLSLYVTLAGIPQPKIIMETPEKTSTTSVKRQLKADKFIIYENGCFDAKFSDGGAGGKYILRCV
jgi:hypothetical protein